MLGQIAGNGKGAERKKAHVLLHMNLFPRFFTQSSLQPPTSITRRIRIREPRR